MPIRTRTVLLALAVCVWFWAGPISGYCAGKAAEFDPASERIGGLRLGLSAEKAAGVVPCAPKPGKEIFEGATGDYVQDWKMPGCGLTLKMAGPKKGSPKEVAAVTVTAPSELATSKGIGIGATEAEVLAAYGRFRDRDGASKAGRMFVAGSIYGGLIFDFKKGRVSRIFLGAAAE